MNLQAVAAGSLAQPLTFIFEPTQGGRCFVQNLTPNSDGTFTLSGVPAGAYNLFVKGNKWLQKLAPVDTTGGSATGVGVSLLGGDLDGNNAVDINDFNILRSQFNSVGPGLSADINCDGAVDINDYNILRANFNSVGDALAPAALTGVVSGVGNGCVVLAWTPSSNATGYKVYRRTMSGSGYTVVSANQTNPYYVDLGVTNGTAYSYIVTALANGTESLDSTLMTATPSATGGTMVAVSIPGTVTPSTTTTTLANGTTYTTIVSSNNGTIGVRVSINFAGSPNAPTRFQGTPGNWEVVLTWDATPGANGYNIYRNGQSIARNYNASQYFDADTNLSEYAFTDVEQTKGTPNEYGVSAVVQGIEGAEAAITVTPGMSPGWVQQHRIDTMGLLPGSGEYDLSGLTETDTRRNGTTYA